MDENSVNGIGKVPERTSVRSIKRDISHVRAKSTGVHGKKELQIIVCQTYRAKCARATIPRLTVVR